MKAENEQALHFTKPQSQTPQSSFAKITRRELLKRSAAIGGSLIVGSGFIAGSTASWALEVKSLSPDTMATLVQMARDIYPHDSMGDEIYAAAVKAHDDKAAEDSEYKTMLETGVDSLNAAAKQMGHASYLATGWEAERTELLKSIESDGFFQTIRGGLVVGLYNQKAVWDALGYEGSSYEKGGYLNRGFDDIKWL